MLSLVKFSDIPIEGHCVVSGDVYGVRVARKGGANNAVVLQGKSPGTTLSMSKDELVVPLVAKKVTTYELA